MDIQTEIVEIKKSIEYQTKLIEEIYQMLDEGRKQKAQAMPNISAIMDTIGSHPAMKSNPAMTDMIRNMFAGIGGKNGG